MPRTPAGLTDEQVDGLRARAAGTRKPRVVLLGTQFGSDVTGQVVAVGDPAVDGDDFVTVRVKIGSVTDTLTFAPRELALPPRTTRAVNPRSSAGTGAADRTAPATPKPARRAAAATKPNRAAAPKPNRAVTPQPTKAPSATGRTTARRRRKPAAVTLMVSSTDDGWTLAASRGGRSLVRGTTIAPGVVTAIADLLAQTGLQQAVAEINEVTRADAEQRAQQLRAELADVESLLQAHQRPGVSRSR